MRVTALLKHLLFQCTSYHHYIKIHANKSTAGVNTLTDLFLSSQTNYKKVPHHKDLELPAIVPTTYLEENCVLLGFLIGFFFRVLDVAL